MPIAAKDVEIMTYGLPNFFEFLPIKKLVIIGNNEVHIKIQSIINRYNIEFLLEDELLSLDAVKKEMNRVCNNDLYAVKRSGWYLQQFIKMMYAFICEDEYYLVWDSDTFPLRKVCMMDGTKPIFHMKNEYYSSYFDTMSRIIPNLGKLEKRSFIAEHMLISTDIMKKLICEIEMNDNLDGKRFYQKILSAIDKSMLSHSGFSEFETYGNYCEMRFPDLYEKRDWMSLREGSKYFLLSNFNKSEEKWIAKEYMAISFEHGMLMKKEAPIYHCLLVQALFSFNKLTSIFEKIRNLKKRK